MPEPHPTASATVTDELRAACAEVAASARFVRLREEAVPAYASALARTSAAAASVDPVAPSAAGPVSPTAAGSAAPEPDPLATLTAGERAAHVLTLDAINFGSGWFPTLRKDPGRSGYRTIAAAWERHAAAHGPLDAERLTELTAADVADILDQDPTHELMELYALSLADLGGHLLAEHGGDPLALVAAAGGSAVALADELGGWASFADRSRLPAGDRDPQASHRDVGELSLPFLKRAQIAAADLHRAGVAEWRDLDRLTMFADNLVPHVLRLDGVLELDPALVTRIEAGELLRHGDPDEVEIRALAVHAVERIVAELHAAAAGAPSPSPPATAAAVDELLWNRGQQPRYKAVPRHRSRCTAY